MDHCPKCKTERKRIGVMFPARRLCNCESGLCRVCKDDAAVVEFQKPVKDVEPSLENSKQARLLCIEHLPEGFPMAAVVAPASESKGRKTKTQKGRLPHIDPTWEASSAACLPAEAEATNQVQCVACKNVHALRKRVMFNGTYSYCPACSTEDMFVPTEEDARD